MMEEKLSVLFNNTFFIFYIQFFGVERRVKDHSDGERKTQLPINGLIFLISTIPQTGLHIPGSLVYQWWSTGWNKK